MVAERMVFRFAGVIWEIGKHHILHQELFERVKQAMKHVKNGDFKAADCLMQELPATSAIWAQVLR